MTYWNFRRAAAPKTPRLEILARLPANPRRAPPLLFVHGAWHAAWCWDEHFLSYFAKAGFACYAVNLRGHGASRGTRDVRFCRVRDFVEDVREAVEEIGGPAPILIGHSLGGFVVQKYLEKHRAELGVLMASVPPSGGWPLFKRVMRLQPLALMRANFVFSQKPLFTDAAKVRSLLFTPETPASIVQDCLARLQDDCILGLPDYLALDLVKPERIDTPIRVIGAAEDRMIDAADIEATARAYGTSPVVIPASGHDLMLEMGWERAAQAVAGVIDRHLGLETETPVRARSVA